MCIRDRAWINQIYDFSLDTYNLRVQIEMLALRALLNEMNGERANALKLLEQSVTLAAPGNLVRMFTDLGATIGPLLIELRDRGCTPEFIHRVIKSLPPMPESVDLSAPHRRPASTADAVSYTHLDVYKRQVLSRSQYYISAPAPGMPPMLSSRMHCTML